MMVRIALVLVVLLTPTLVFADDIAGFWKHAEEPGWIEIRPEEGSGTVVRNDLYPERVGRQLVKDLVADDSREGVWRGQVYAERLGEYKDAEISMPEPDRMQFKVKVGFMSRTIDWVRVDEVPAGPAKD